MAGPSARPSAVQRPTLRIDKWLWQARFFKSRSLAAEFAEDGHLRINGQPTRKAGHAVATGDVLTFPLGDRIRVIRVRALGYRRGPATEAETLYDDLDAPKAGDAATGPLE